jgi:hypothetical protein
MKVVNGALIIVIITIITIITTTTHTTDISRLLVCMQGVIYFVINIEMKGSSC